MRKRHGNGNGHGRSLEIEAQRLLPTPNTMDGMGPRSTEALERARLKGGCSNLKDVGSFDSYRDAIERWKRILGRDAPSPTEPHNGRPRLSARFVEWMMGLPAGWVTGVDGITHTQSLKILGNGVVPQQAAHALQILLERV